MSYNPAIPPPGIPQQPPQPGGANDPSSACYDEQLAPLDNQKKFFMANVDFSTTAQQVKTFFSQYGNVNYVKLVPHQQSGGMKHRGFGFLFMMDEPPLGAW